MYDYISGPKGPKIDIRAILSWYCHEEHVILAL